MPALHYRDYSSYICHNFDSIDNMRTLEIFTDKWDRYVQERGSKDTNKECLKEDYYYSSNRLPKILTSEFKLVKNAQGEVRTKAYLTVFIPTHRIECTFENQRYLDNREEEISHDNLIIFGILSPLCPGSIPDVRFYTNNLRTSQGFKYTAQTFDQPLYIKDFDKVQYFMSTIMRDIFKFPSKNMYSYDANPNQFGPKGEEINNGLPHFKNYYYVPVNMKKS